MNETAKTTIWIPLLGTIHPVFALAIGAAGLLTVAILKSRYPNGKKPLPQPLPVPAVTVATTAAPPQTTVTPLGEQETVRQYMSALGKKSAESRKQRRIERGINSNT
jgi:hypothetical protein